MTAVIPKKTIRPGTNHHPIAIQKNPKRNSESPILVDYILCNQIYITVNGKSININVSTAGSSSKSFHSSMKCFHTKSLRRSKQIALPNRYHIKPATKNPTKISIAKIAVFIVVSV
jgi:carbonic anhydrase